MRVLNLTASLITDSANRKTTIKIYVVDTDNSTLVASLTWRGKVYMTARQALDYFRKHYKDFKKESNWDLDILAKAASDGFIKESSVPKVEESK